MEYSMGISHSLDIIKGRRFRRNVALLHRMTQWFFVMRWVNELWPKGRRQVGLQNDGRLLHGTPWLCPGWTKILYYYFHICHYFPLAQVYCF